MSTIICDSKTKKVFSKEAPFLAKIKERYLLNKEGSTKKTYHLSLDISSSEIEYEEGDAIGILPSNPSYLVNPLISLINSNPKENVIDPREKEPFISPTSYDLLEYLTKKVNLSKVTPSLLKVLKTFCSNEADRNFFEQMLLEENKDKRASLMSSFDVITLLKKYPLYGISAQNFIESLAPMLPRFYSIASSYQKHPNEIHLLVGTFSFMIQDEIRAGVGSEFLCSIAEHASQIPLYLHKNPNFKLPHDLSAPVIMIGAGTGLAPYKGFLEKRAYHEQTKNWLVFGERESKVDFYYEEYLRSLEKSSILKLSTAFSRDQQEKVYIQHRLYEERATIWQWICEGAYLYLCGDAKQMAKDVIETLTTIISEMSETSLQEAKAFLQELKKAKRFQLDIY